MCAVTSGSHATWCSDSWLLWLELSQSCIVTLDSFFFFFFPEEHISFYAWVLLNSTWAYKERTEESCEVIVPFASCLKSVLCCKQANSFATCNCLQAKMKWADVLYSIPSIQVSTVWKVLLPLASFLMVSAQKPNGSGWKLPFTLNWGMLAGSMDELWHKAAPR